MKLPRMSFIQSDEDNNIFKCKLNYCKDNVNKIQNDVSRPSADVFMTFYPIAKNIRVCSSYMTLNILNGRKSKLSLDARPGESDFWRNNFKEGHWFPWLWARGRIDGSYTNQQGWNYYFDSFRDDDIVQLDVTGELTRPSDDDMTFFTHLASLLYSFNLNDSYNIMIKKYEDEMKWPENRGVLAIHIRRGDIVPTGKLMSIAGRPFYCVEKYLECADKLLENDSSLEYVFVATDSDEEINLVRSLRPTWKLLYVPIDRSNFYRLDHPSLHIHNDPNPIFLDQACSNQPHRIPFTVDSALADLYFIGKSNAFVGANLKTAEFTRAGLLLQFAMNERMTAYADTNDSEEYYDTNDPKAHFILT